MNLLIRKIAHRAVLGWLSVSLAVAGVAGCDASGKPAEPTAAAQPALSVVASELSARDWDTSVAVSGNVEPWQTLDVDAEIAGARLDSVEVEIGARVRRGQVLAHLDARDLHDRAIEQRAAVAEARANLAQARAKLDGTQQLASSGATSQQQLIEARTEASVGAARLQAAQARLASAERDLQRSTVTAPAPGIVATRTAVVGSITTVGAHLFKLIRDGRLQWQAQVGADALGRIKPGQRALLQVAGGAAVHGTVRSVAPLVDPATLTGTVYIDLPADSGIPAGSIVAGEISTGRAAGLAAPQSAILTRDGFQYVMVIGTDQRVHPVKVRIGAEQHGIAQVLAGPAAGTRIVVSGAAFLNDGDRVRVLPAPAAAPKQREEAS